MAKPKKDTPKEGHNIEGLSDAQRQALHLSRHVPDYAKALEAKKAADANLKNVCKVIKADGGSVEKVKRTIALQTPEGEAAFRAMLADLHEVAIWNGLGVQIDLFADERKPSEDKAFDAGKRAGMAGETAKPPHDPSTVQAKRWLEGHAEGQAIVAAGFKKKQPEQAEAA